MRSIKIIRKNKYEVYLSFLVVCFGFLFSQTHRPINFYDVLIWVGSLVAGLLSATNAVMDYGRMNIFERVIGFTWLGILLFTTSWVIWDALNIKTFADR